MDYHILTQDVKRRTIKVIFHIPVPEAGENQAGISWTNAVVAAQGGSGEIVSALTNISGEEDTKLKAGSIVEVTRTVRFSSITLTPAERRQEIEAAFMDAVGKVIGDKQIELEWIGYENNVT